jgi:DNA polymerase III epsilon subunit-like protein
MSEFVAIDFETANPARVSACAVGITKVSNSHIAESTSYLVKPVGGHKAFLSRIHGITEAHTFDKPEFGDLFPEIREIFDYPLVGHSLFDKQVINALSDHFGLGLKFEYIDSCATAKNQMEKLPNLKNCKLETLVEYFGLPAYRQHDAGEDSKACAHVYLELLKFEEPGELQSLENELEVYQKLITKILEDNVVSYKEAYELLYWFEDHPESARHHKRVFSKVKEVLDDDYLDEFEALEMRSLLRGTLDD